MKHVIKIEDLRQSKCAHLNPHLFGEIKPIKKKSKYGNEKTEVNGIKFDSIKEAEYYKKLLLLVKAGEIGLLELQVPYELNPGGTYSLKYLADFEYVIMKTGEKKTVDVKGFRTTIYKKKRRLMLKVHGINIIEL